MRQQYTKLSLEILGALYEVQRRTEPPLPMSLSDIKEQIFGEHGLDYDEETLRLELTSLEENDLVTRSDGKWVRSSRGLRIGSWYVRQCERVESGKRFSTGESQSLTYLQ